MLRDFRREYSCHGQVIRCKILNALIIKRLYQLRQSYLRNSHGSKKKRDSGQYYYCTYFNHDWNFHFWKISDSQDAGRESYQKLSRLKNQKFSGIV